MDKPKEQKDCDPKARPLILGIVGGIGSGKSAVSASFASLGAHVLDADHMAHDCLAEQDVQEAIIARFGEDSRNSDGTINRPSLATRLFAGRESERRATKEFLHQLLHPRIRARISSAIKSISENAKDGSRPVIVIDAPLLLEGPLAAICDSIIFVEASAETRTARTIAHRQWDPSERERREASQMPLDEKRRRAHFIISNDGTRHDLQKQVTDLLSNLLARD
jgi:dephospho-CoA kinase